MEGATSVYEDFGDTGAVVRRVFCGACGTPIESQSSYSFPRYAAIKVGAFDDPHCFVPDDEVYCASALPWVISDINRPRRDTISADASRDETIYLPADSCCFSSTRMRKST